MLWKAQGIFADQPMLLELDAPMQAWLTGAFRPHVAFNMASAEVVGDVHGQYYDLHLGGLGGLGGADLTGLPGPSSY